MTTQKVIWWICWSLYALFLRVVLRARVSGTENIPREGPLLVLANHTSVFDPPSVGVPLGRITHFMATEQLFRGSRFVAWLITNLNAFPKAKGVADRRAMKYMLRAYRDGDAVVLFPEGERSWAGRTLPMVDSTAAFLHRIRARVVYCRLKTAHLVMPRWARYLRFTPLVIEYSRLHDYGAEDSSVARIEQDMLDNLRIDPEHIEPVGLGFGYRMAWGLPEYLWACPRCFAQGGVALVPRRGDAIGCTACGARWRLDLSQRLHSEVDGVPDLHVVTAADRIHDHFGTPPISDRARFEQDGVVLEEDAVRVSLIKPDQQEPIPICTGAARLAPGRLSVVGDDGDELWGQDLAALKAVLTQVGSRIHLRTASGNVQLDTNPTSLVKWTYFLQQYHAHALTGRQREKG